MKNQDSSGSIPFSSAILLGPLKTRKNKKKIDYSSLIMQN